MAHRLDSLYAKTADQDGVVTAITDKSITVTYTDKSTLILELGRRYGKWSGKVIPHSIATTLQVGQEFKQGDLLCYNEKFFAIDTLVPGTAIYKTGVLARTVLWESTTTLEDSSGVTPEFARKLETEQTHVRDLYVGFDQEIRNLLTVGETVDEDSILCTLHAASGGGSTLFSDSALDTLRTIGRLTPKAKYAGKIERIEVLYCGDPEHMTTTLKALTTRADNELYRLCKQTGRKPTTGEVVAGFRVGGTPVEESNAVIRVYITGLVPLGIGDKVVFANQLKSVVGQVMTGVQTTEDGSPIDANFGYQSIANRIVNSGEIIGTTNAIMLAVTERVIKAYES